MTMLTITELRGGYTRADVLHGITLTVDAGTAVGLIGRNGAGKTCLAELLIGRQRPRAGAIHLDGKPIEKLRPSKRIRAGLSLVPEGRLVFGELTVRENLVAAAYGAGTKLSSRELSALEDRFEVLGRKRDDRAAGMSGGEQQILAIGRALVQRPKVMVLDEPSLGLAPVMTAVVTQALRALLDDGMALLLMEQNRMILSELCEEVHVMNQGTLVARVSPDAQELGDVLFGEAAS